MKGMRGKEMRLETMSKDEMQIKIDSKAKGQKRETVRHPRERQRERRKKNRKRERSSVQNKRTKGNPG